MDTEFLLKVMKLKDEPRTGWMKHGVTYPESVAAHTFGAAFLTFLFADDSERDIDREKAVRMALVHDIQEQLTGDIPGGDLTDEQEQEKKERERAALQELLDMSDTDTTEIEELWSEFNTRSSDTARFVKDMEELDMALQAYLYATEKRATANKDLLQKSNAMREFFDHAEKTIRNDDFRSMVRNLRQKALKEHNINTDES